MAEWARSTSTPPDKQEAQPQNETQEQQLAKQQAAATLPAAAAATPPATTAATPAVNADPETSNPEEPDTCLVLAAPESSDSEPNPC